MGSEMCIRDSYQGVLERGYALVQRRDEEVVRSKDEVDAGEAVTLTFADGTRGAVINGPASVSKKIAKKAQTKAKTANNQQDLF